MTGEHGPVRAAGIIGLGLMGGSLARDLAAAGWRVLGADRDPGTVDAATEAGVIAGPLDPAAGHAGVDLVVVAVPVRAAPGWVRRLAEELSHGVVVTDVGSTKRSVVEAAESAGLGPRFVGSHPMTGDHRSGWAAARSGLYSGARVWLSPTASTRPDALAAVADLWRTVGAEPDRIDADEHDRLLARSSHLPQLVASALAAALAREGVPREALGPGGRDTTRLAGSDPEMWLDILVDNADRIGPALDTLLDTLSRSRDALGTGSEASLHDLLARGRVWFDGGAPE
ncbi:MAG: prephenate dehydrogenase/arogenate dehydrogenase family protein [Longimicrobiales bacterium]|nr:prephenate dehydrogenase/arogenate dehydrogenase family protein [Longimicrobiales bacterium]